MRSPCRRPAHLHVTMRLAVHVQATAAGAFLAADAGMPYARERNDFIKYMQQAGYIHIMPHPLARLAMELRNLNRVLAPADFARYVKHLVFKAHSWIPRRTLDPIDHAMKGEIVFHVEDARIVIPLDVTERLLEGHDPTSTFGGAREMYAGNVYLRGFRKGLQADNVLDLGSNRGLFLMLAAKVLGAETAIGVEPEVHFEPVFAAISKSNADVNCRFHRINALASSRRGHGKTTVADIMNDCGIADIGFLKCDIEGGEFDVFCSNNDFLNRVANIAMEVHPDKGNPQKGDVACLVNVLRDFGFDVCVTDQFATPVDFRHERACYLYAPKTGDLALPCNQG